MTVITTFDALMDRIVPLKHIKKSILEYSLGDTLDMEETKARLVRMGYERNYQVEAAGQFAVRGGILDIFPLTEENPCRIELWGDEIDSMRWFDVESQRSIENLEQVRIYPASEVVLFPEMMERGLRKLQKEEKELYERFRKEMKTEEAHRLKTAVDAFVEEVTELGQGAGIDSYLMYFLEEAVSFLDYFDWEHTILFLDEPARLAEKSRVVEAGIF